MYEGGIGAGLFEFFEELTGIVELVIVDDSVDRDIDLRPKGMGITAELGNVGDRVACCHPGPETTELPAATLAPKREAPI